MEIDFLNRIDHEYPHDNEGRTVCAFGNSREDRGQKQGYREKDGCCQGGEACSSAFFNTGGGFYVSPRGDTWAFKFNPGQKLRALFGWSSTYKGEL